MIDSIQHDITEQDSFKCDNGSLELNQSCQITNIEMKQRRCVKSESLSTPKHNKQPFISHGHQGRYKKETKTYYSPFPFTLYHIVD